VIESLDPHVLREVVDILFPTGVEGSTLEWGPDVYGSHEITEDVEISRDEFVRFLRRIGSNKAPGPDGVTDKIWVQALGFVGERLRTIQRVPQTSRFPQPWKRTKLVLLVKEGKEAGSPSAYRPICLLDKVGKLFERIIARRLVQHLSRNGMGLHEEQYGFREGRSTIDAILLVRSLREATVTEGGVALAVSLDIANAFNTLS